MGRKNCWEVKDCGREPGGVKTTEFGVCPACTDGSFDGLNGGQNGGRICWAVTGTFCGGKVQGTYAAKKLSCMSCEVYRQIKEEEGLGNFRIMKPGQVYKDNQR